MEIKCQQCNDIILIVSDSGYYLAQKLELELRTDILVCDNCIDENCFLCKSRLGLQIYHKCDNIYCRNKICRNCIYSRNAYKTYCSNDCLDKLKINIK